MGSYMVLVVWCNKTERTTSGIYLSMIGQLDIGVVCMLGWVITQGSYVQSCRTLQATACAHMRSWSFISAADLTADRSLKACASRSRALELLQFFLLLERRRRWSSPAAADGVLLLLGLSEDGTGMDGARRSSAGGPLRRASAILVRRTPS